MRKLLISLLFFLTSLPLYGQVPDLKPETAANKVEGLELPPDQTVPNDEGFITIKAVTKGTVKWLVVSGVKVKYVITPDNSIVISIPPQGGLITVFAVSLTENKLTEFARTNINVNTSVATPPNLTAPAPVNPLHVTFLADENSVTPEIAAILNSKNLQAAVAAKGNFLRYYNIKSPVVTQKKLDAAVQKAGGPFVVIVQKNDGTIILAQAVPRTEQEVFALLKNVGGL